MKHTSLAVALLLSAACLPAGRGEGSGGGGEPCDADGHLTGGDIGCEPVVTPGEGRVVATPEYVVFAPTAVGAFERFPVTLENVGETALTITSATLIEDDSDRLSEITLIDTFSTPLELAPGATHELLLDWSPLNTTADAATLTLTLADVDAEPLVIDVTTPSLGPDVVASPTSVSFPSVSAGQTDRQVLEIWNAGGSVLHIADVFVSPAGSEFSVSFPTGERIDDPAYDDDTFAPSIPAGDAMPIRVTYSPEANATRFATLVVSTNDPDEPWLEVTLSGNTGSPGGADLGGVVPVDTPIGDETHALDFGEHTIPLAHTETVQIHNAGQRDLVVDATLTGDAAFSIPSTSELGLPIRIGADEIASIPVTFTPTSLGDVGATLNLSTDDSGDAELVVRLTGEGVEDVCPEAVALATVVGSDEPPSGSITTTALETIQFDGSSSAGGSGRYEWDVVEKPLDSNARLGPSHEYVNPRMSLDLPGRYVVALTTFSRLGLPSCAPSTVEVVAR